MERVFTLRILRPGGGLRVELEFHCANLFDEERLSRLARRLARQHRIQVWCGPCCVDYGPAAGREDRGAVFPL